MNRLRKFDQTFKLAAILVFLTSPSLARSTEISSPNQVQHLESLSPKGRTEEFWRQTGIDVSNLDKLKMFSSLNCLQNQTNFEGCVSGINAIVSYAEPPLRLVPVIQVKGAEIVKSFGLMSFVKIPARELFSERSGDLTDAQASAKKLAERSRWHKDMALIYSNRDEHFDFDQVYSFAKKAGFRTAKSEAAIVGESINSYLRESMDPHARLQPLAEVEFQNRHADSRLCGIGAEMKMQSGKLTLVDTADNSPALQAGMRLGDQLLKVNGVSIVGREINEVVDAIRGVAGTKVQLRILREGKEFDLEVTRGNVVFQNVKWNMVTDTGKKVAHIRIKSFSDRNACSSLRGAISDAETRGAESLVLDLRSNPGGNLDQAICIGRLFVGEKEIVKVKDLHTNEFVSAPQVNDFGQVTKLPLVVLINQESASASEIVAGALQDYRRAWVIGERSFGKGSVQAAETTSFNAKILKFQTIERFYQPSGRTNQLSGIIPDVVVPFKANATVQERVAAREADYYSHALVDEGPAWKQPRPDDVKKLSTCMANGVAAELTKKSKTKSPQFDYQLVSAEDALSCQGI